MYAKRVGKAFEEISVSTDLKEAYEFIIGHLTQIYNITPPFILMLGKIHITGALNKQSDIPLKDGDTFKIVPSISGG